MNIYQRLAGQSDLITDEWFHFWNSEQGGFDLAWTPTNELGINVCQNGFPATLAYDILDRYHCRGLLGILKDIDETARSEYHGIPIGWPSEPKGLRSLNKIEAEYLPRVLDVREQSECRLSFTFNVEEGKPPSDGVFSFILTLDEFNPVYEFILNRLTVPA